MKQKIDKNSKIPLYIQLADIFIEDIEKNMHENDKLDTEREISKQYSLSRVTVRLLIIFKRMDIYIKSKVKVILLPNVQWNKI